MLEQYAMPGVSTNIEPTLSARLQHVLDHFGGRVMIESGYRSKAQQQKLYDDWLASGKTNPPSVAVPGTSKHERDPAEAADLHRTDPSLTWGEVHYTAAAYGLWFPINREDWHAELDPAWVAPPEEDDMTPQQLATAFGPEAEIGLDGVIRVPLINDDLKTHTKYPLADVLTFIHQELKMNRLLG
jgi:hypothetical protein